MRNKALQTFDPTEPPTDFAPAAATDHDRDRAYRRQAAAVALSRRAAAPPNLQLLIQDAAALVAETLSVERFGFAELNAGRSALEMHLGGIATSVDSLSGDMSPGSMLQEQCSLDPRLSLAAYAHHAGEVVAVADLATDWRFADRWLSEHGVRSAVVVPLRFGVESYGVFGAFGSQPREFARDDLMYAEMIAHLVSTNIARDRTTKILESERRFARKVLETVDALVLVLTPAGRIVRANLACEQVTGFTCDEVRDRPIWSALLVPGEASVVKDLLAGLTARTGPLEHESFLLTKQAERRRIQWSFAMLPSSGDGEETILATGIDITERRVAEEEIGRLRSVEAETQRRLQSVLEELEIQKTAAAQGTAISNVPPSDVDTADSEAGGWGSDNKPFHPLPQGKRGDRRRRLRRAFAYFQRIAPAGGGRIPPLRMFRRVQCLDISAGGFSFLSSTAPSETEYVVALGNPPVVIHVAARVVHVTPTNHEGRPMHLVGCAYTGRLDY